MRLLGSLATAAALVVAGAAGPARAAEGRVLGVGVPGAVTGRYIVTPKQPRAGYTATMSARQARRLAADPGVLFVEQDRKVHVEAATQRNPVWGLDRIDQRSVTGSKTYTPLDDGSSVHAYVIDTGIRITHREFAGRAAYGWDFVDGDSTASDCDGHGTHVAGTIGGIHYGVAKKVRLVAVRVLDCSGSGYLSDVIAGVDWVTAHAVKPAVVNMSLGGTRSTSLDAAVARSIKAGITYVVAAGNENANASTSSPAAVAAAITVGATDSRDRRASFSNYGSGLDLFAPGVGIRSSYAGSDTATAVDSGTSMAAPHVTGAAALVLDAAPGYTPAQVLDFLVVRATKGAVTDPKGSPNRLLFVPPPPAAPVVTSTALHPAAGQTYTSTFRIAPTRRGTWTIVGGSLPKGMSMTSQGALRGVPSGPGTATVKVQFADYVPNVVTKTITVQVAHRPPAFAVQTLPELTAGAGRDVRITITDKRTGTWRLTGDLPDGMTFAGGLLSGTPSTPGDYGFTVTFTDGWGTAVSRAFTLTVG
jgi:subtilisin family serine protease